MYIFHTRRVRVGEGIECTHPSIDGSMAKVVKQLTQPVSHVRWPMMSRAASAGTSSSFVGILFLISRLIISPAFPKTYMWDRCSHICRPQWPGLLRQRTLRIPRSHHAQHFDSIRGCSGIQKLIELGSSGQNILPALGNSHPNNLFFVDRGAMGRHGPGQRWRDGKVTFAKSKLAEPSSQLSWFRLM